MNTITIKNLENINLRGDAVDDELVQPGPDLAQLPRALLRHDLGGRLLDVELPVQLLDLLVGAEGILGHLKWTNQITTLQDHESGPCTPPP